MVGAMCKEGQNSTLRTFFTKDVHYVKSVQTRSYFWFVFSCTRTENKEIRTRNNFVFGHFSRSAHVVTLTHFCSMFSSNIPWSYQETLIKTYSLQNNLQ